MRPALGPGVRHARSRLGAASRWGEQAEIATARHDLAVAKLAAHIRLALADVTLTEGERDHLAGLIRGS